jgi:hypothetical protein
LDRLPGARKILAGDGPLSKAPGESEALKKINYKANCVITQRKDYAAWLRSDLCLGMDGMQAPGQVLLGAVATVLPGHIIL